MDKNILLPEPLIENKIYIIREKKVMLDYDLAKLYESETKRLNEAVKRNLERFPPDFMFQLTKIEEANLKSQIATSSLEAYGGRRKPISAFTEQGVAMLSSVLGSKRAIAVNVQIMRTFTRIREMLSSHRELKEKIEELEKKYDNQFKLVFEVIHRLIAEEEKPKEKLGFKTE